MRHQRILLSLKGLRLKHALIMSKTGTGDMSSFTRSHVPIVGSIVSTDSSTKITVYTDASVAHVAEMIKTIVLPPHQFSM